MTRFRSERLRPWAVATLALGALLTAVSCDQGSSSDAAFADAGTDAGGLSADAGTRTDAEAPESDAGAPGPERDAGQDGGAATEVATISRYPKPDLYPASGVYALKANGFEIPVIQYTEEYDYAHFSMSRGAAALEVTALTQAAVSSHWISPKKLELEGSTSANKLTFSIEKDEYLIIIINKQKKLVVAADPEETDKPASSGPGIHNVVDAPYGADGTGATLATRALQSAIDDASANQGGIVYVPAGVYLVGNLELKSHVKLYLEGGAVLRCTGNPADYTTHFHKNSQNKDGTWWIHTAEGASDIQIYGRGTLDGNGAFMRNTHGYVNNILVPLNTSDFRVDGILFRDSALWSFLIVRSNDVTITNFKQFNSLTMLETDGIDVCESQNVRVTNAIAIGEDDPFSTKTWDVETTDIAENWYGSPEPLSQVTFDDCISWTGCQAFKVGMGTKQSQTGVTFKNSVVYDAAKAIAVQHSYGTAEVSDVTFENIDIEAVRGKRWGGPYWFLGIIENASALGTGAVTNLVLRDIRLREMGTNRSVLRGYSSASAFQGVSFDNIVLPDNRVAGSIEDLRMNVNGHVDELRINGEPLSAPDAPGVVFYQDAHYTGAASQPIAKGDYTLAQLQALGVVNDKVTSLSVPAGWSVVAYDGDNFGGAACTFEGSSTYVGEACNDRMSSCRIR